MRKLLECAILVYAQQELWVNDLIHHTHAQSDKLRLTKIDLDEHSKHLNPAQTTAQQYEHYPSLDILNALRIQLMRYDLILLPVAHGSLAWTRMLIDHSDTPSLRPIVGMGIDVNPLGFYDLLTLGASDYICEPFETNRLRVRLMAIYARHTTVESRPGLTLLNARTAPANTTATAVFLENLTYKPKEVSSHLRKPKRISKPFQRSNEQQSLAVHEVFTAGDSFKAAKAKVVDEFERTFIIQALQMSKGNIGEAARQTNKHRRAFWELMRKHHIDAEQYREG